MANVKHKMRRIREHVCGSSELSDTKSIAVALLTLGALAISAAAVSFFLAWIFIYHPVVFAASFTVVTLALFVILCGILCKERFTREELPDQLSRNIRNFQEADPEVTTPLVRSASIPINAPS